MKYVLITGAGGGMGRAVVDIFAKNGFCVFAVDREESAGSENVIPVKADVTDECDVLAAYEAVKSVTDSLCAVIHLAGIYRLDSLVEMPPDEFEKIFRINLGGAFLVNRTFLPLMKENTNIIVVTSELAVRDPLPFTGIYGVTKTALDKYAYSLRMELQLRNINVSVLRAGAVDTGMISVSTNQLDKFCRGTKLYSCNAKRFKSIVDSVEAKRIPPEKLAEKLYRISQKRRPKFAYSINRNPLLILLDRLPKRARFFIIRQILKSQDGDKTGFNQ